MNRFLTLLGLLLAVAILLRIDFIFYIIYVCIALFAWSHWYTPRAWRNLKLNRQFADHAFLGETVPVKLRLSNPNILPLPWLQFSESVAPELSMGERPRQVIALRAKDEAEFSYELKAKKRGYYQIGPTRLVTGDLFGLAPEQTAYLAPEILTVYPEIIPLARLGLPSRLPFGTIVSRQRLFADPTRPMGVREFQSGDSLRQINWKVSAHTMGTQAGSLLVKTFEPAISLETAVVLNLNRNDYSDNIWHESSEWAIKLAASLAAHLINQRQPVGLRCNGTDPLRGQATADLAFDTASGRLLINKQGQSGQTATAPPPIPTRTGRAHLMKILEQLARIETSRTPFFGEWLHTTCLGLSWGITILVLTPQGDNATCEALHRLVRSGFNPVLLAFEPDHNFGLVQERSRRLGFAAFNIVRPADLVDWQRG